MPPLAPFFAHSRVLCATDRRVGHIARHADIAADALADILDPTFFDLFRQEWVGDRWPRRADEIERALGDHCRHAVR